MPFEPFICKFFQHDSTFECLTV
uniref:Uncharacterized protein n=1 Tax=Arundo donax TaxID=35708 RepID=A0A0A9F8Z8_ARUDO